MSNVNQLDKSTFIVYHIILGIVLSILYLSFVFIPYSHHDDKDSMILFGGIVLAFIVFGIYCTYKYRRNYVSLVVNTLIPFELYTLMTYSDFLIYEIESYKASIVLITLIYFIWKNTGKRRFKNNTALNHGLALRTIFTFLLAIMIGKSLIPYLIDINFEKSQEGNISQENVVEYLQEDVWTNLTFEERFVVMEEMLDMECDYLGIPYELELEATDLDYPTVGQHANSLKLVRIDSEYLETKSISEVLNVICHEAYHAYQYCLVDLYERVDDEDKRLRVFSDVEVYKDEFNNYINVGDAYYNQTCEVKSREYAEYAVERYRVYMEGGS